MPDWIGHSQNFRRFLRRWGIGGSNLYELLSGVLPVALVDRSWQDDELDLFGVSTLSASVAGHIPALVIFAPLQLDTYIRQLEVFATAGSIGSGAIGGQLVSLFTPATPYNPILANQVLWHPGLFCSRNNVTPQTGFITGDNTVFQGPPFAPAQFLLDYQFVDWGGVYYDFVTTTPGAFLANNVRFATGASFFLAKRTIIHSFEQPPMRIPAGTVMAIQLGDTPSVAYSMICTILFQEQNALEF